MKRFIVVQLFLLAALSGCDFFAGKKTLEYLDDSRFTVIKNGQNAVNLTLVSDLQCPHCRSFFQSKFEQLRLQVLDKQMVNYRSAVVGFVPKKSLEKASVLKVIEKNEPEHYLDVFGLAYSEEIFNGTNTEYAQAIVANGLFSGSVEELLLKSNDESIIEEVKNTKTYVVGEGLMRIPTLLLNGKPIEAREVDEIVKLIQAEISL